MKATEILRDARLPMLELWRLRARESARAIAQAAGRPPPTSRNSESQLLPEIFYGLQDNRPSLKNHYLRLNCLYF